MKIEAAPSPNFNQRKTPVDMLVLHYTGMETGQAALDRMSNAEAQVSAHYMLWEDGRVVQLVGEDKRAWHAGVSGWQGGEDLNSRSIGIEIVNGGHDWPLPDGSLPAYPEAQIEALITLCHGILSRWDIPQTNIVGHSDIAPLRKDDPGEHFPWKTLSEAGIGLYPETKPGEIETPLQTRALVKGDEGEAVTAVQRMLGQVGYILPETTTYDDATQATIRAFQRRWVQESVTGTVDLATLRTLDHVRALYLV